jgi:hypothetical protein
MIPLFTQSINKLKICLSLIDLIMFISTYYVSIRKIDCPNELKNV